MISGGEPFLRDDLDEICNLFSQNSAVRKISIPTNGSLPDVIVKKVKSICRNTESLVNINLSLDGFEQLHDALRGKKGIFEKAVTTGKMLKELKKDYDFTFRVLTVISNRNISQLKEFSNYVKMELNPDLHAFDIIRGDLKSDLVKPPSNHEVRAFLGFLKEWTAKHYGDNQHFKRRFKFFYPQVLNFRDQVIDYCCRVNPRETDFVPCYADKLASVIYPNGDFSFCELMDSFANIRQFNYDIKGLFKSAQARNLSKTIRTCSCSHGCFQSYNLMLSSKHLIKSFVSKS
jgi:MoaA/NifB/PqqE/SkfB family radical SAM enzyme